LATKGTHYLHLQRGTAEKLQEFIGKTKTNTGLRMRRIAIDFSNDIAVAPNALKGQQLPAQGNAA
jgi:hypothetical protein